MHEDKVGLEEQPWENLSEIRDLPTDMFPAQFCILNLTRLKVSDTSCIIQIQQMFKWVVMIASQQGVGMFSFHCLKSFLKKYCLPECLLI